MAHNDEIIVHYIPDAPICKRLNPINLENEMPSGNDDSWMATPPSYALVDENEEPVLNASRHKVIDLSCEVEASPSSVTFHWTFNNSKDLQDVPMARYLSDGTTSRLRHLLRREEDYGTFGCWASNVVGHSKQPCVYHVPAPGTY